MPNPKLGTVSEDIVKTVNKVKNKLAEIKSDKDGNLGVSIGRKNFADLTVPNFLELAKTVKMNYLLVGSSSEFKEKLEKAFNLTGPVLLEIDVLSVGEMPRYFVPPPFTKKDKSS